jgi:hypothetical protein
MYSSLSCELTEVLYLLKANVRLELFTKLFTPMRDHKDVISGIKVVKRVDKVLDTYAVESAV